jgi:SAM-dependent methyltransferase
VTTWRITQAESRRRYLTKFDRSEVDAYDSLVARLSREDQDAYLADLERVFQFRDGMKALDAGAGTGALSAILARRAGLSLTALEPSPVMLAKLKERAELADLVVVEGFCDSVEDRLHFAEAQFDVIASRQLVNGLFDPLAAFRNWHYWLAPGGAVIVIDGAYGRDAWTGTWAEEVDVLPASATQSTATTPYLLEAAGFRVETVSWMDAVNRRPATRTRRYVVVARRGQPSR